MEQNISRDTNFFFYLSMKQNGKCYLSIQFSSRLKIKVLSICSFWVVVFEVYSLEWIWLAASWTNQSAVRAKGKTQKSKSHENDKYTRTGRKISFYRWQSSQMVLSTVKFSNLTDFAETKCQQKRKGSKTRQIRKPEIIVLVSCI
jgi:hypothetical protein